MNLQRLSMVVEKLQKDVEELRHSHALHVKQAKRFEHLTTYIKKTYQPPRGVLHPIRIPPRPDCLKKLGLGRDPVEGMENV
jgi:hypothetical protein